MAHSSTRKFSALSLVAASVVTLASLAVSGCATGIIAPSSIEATPLAVQGTVFGGATPIYGANVILWETDPTNSGYPSASVEKSKILAGSLSGAVTTSATGGFSFGSAAACDTGTQLYITATGGSLNGTAPGTNGALVNNNLVLISALGSCAKFPTAGRANVKVTITEETTIAAAYALGAFTYVDNTTPGMQGVYIGAPANNNATTGVCTGAGSTMTCTAAGLSHAFANALNLVDSVHTDGTLPSGLPYTTVPGNALGSVPVAQVNALANILAACTNSGGGSGTGGAGGGSDMTPCGNLFSYTKGTSVPVDELTAAIAIGKNPTRNVATLYAIIGTGNGAPFTNSLTTAPPNWAIGITYTGHDSSIFGAPQYLALDANDNVYVLASDGYTTITKSGVVALNSVGTKIWDSGQLTSITVPKFIATDTVGNAWVTNEATAAAAAIVGFNQVDGTQPTSHTFTAATTPAVASQPQGLAIDQYNNVWYDQGSTVSPTLVKIPYSSGASTGGTYGTPVTEATLSAGPLSEILFDGYQNAWFSTFGNSSTASPAQLYVVPNTAAATPSTTPAYTVTTTPFSYSANPTYYTWGLSIDGSNNIWAEQNKAFEELTQTKTNGVITGNPTAALITGATQTKPYETEFDGAGQVWFNFFASNGSINVIYTPTVASIASKPINPCYLPNAATVCPTATYPLVNGNALQIDSTGSVWASGPGTNAAAPGNGVVVQLIGAAYPTWPQLSYAHFGTLPQ